MTAGDLRLTEEQVEALEKRDEENEASDGRNCGIMRCFRRLGEMTFPEQVGLAINTATQALDSIVKHLKQVQEDEQTFRSAGMTTCDSLHFGNNSTDCYVPRKCTESRIYFALKESSAASPAVVLVYGGPGRGKTTVARQIGLTLGRDKSSFAHVLLLECGIQADVEAKQMELLQSLGGDDLSAMSGSQSSQCDCKRTRHSLLRAFLKQQKMLIILDDVWEPCFLQSFLELRGAGVKYIITSQRQDLCEELACTYIPLQIEDLGSRSDDARKNLAVRVGFSKQLIPDHIKDMAEKILAQAAGISLVIAQLGAQIRNAESGELEVWESLVDNFRQYLHETPSRYVLGNTYPKSWWATMKPSCDLLSDKSKQLLILLGICKGPSVPESVLQFLYCSADSTEGCTKIHFSKIKTDLKSRQLIFENDQRWLSLHPSTKMFILDEMNDTVKSITGYLSGGNSHPQQQTFQTRNTENRVTILLSCLYLDPVCGQVVNSQTGYSFDTFGELKRAIVEPFTQLLVPEAMFGTNYSPTEFRTSATQVFDTFRFEHCPHRAEIQTVVVSVSHNDGGILVGYVDSYGWLVVCLDDVDNGAPLYTANPRDVGIGEGSWAGHSLRTNLP